MTRPDECKLVPRFQFASTILSSMVIVVGILGLASWIFGPVMSAPLPAGTALALLLLGIALRALVTRTSEHGMKSEATMYAMAAAALGAVVLILHILPRLGAQQGGAQFILHTAEQMSSVVALAVLLLGLSLAMLQTRHSVCERLGQLINAAVAIVAFYACVASLFDGATLSLWVMMPPLAALSLLAACLSALSAKPERMLDGLFCTEQIGGVVSRRAVAIAICVLALSSWLLLRGTELGRYDATFAIVVYMVWCVVLFVGAVIYAGGLLNRLDSQRRDAVDQFQQLSVAAEVSFQSVHEAIIFIDIDGRVEAWNRQVERMLGWSKDEIAGQVLYEFIVPPESRDEARSVFEKMKDVPGSFDFERQHHGVLLRKDGQRIPVELSVSPIRTESKTSFCLVLRDVSERNRLSEEVALARDQAMESSRMKSEFVANMSHEIRTPLNAIIGMTDILARRKIPAELHDMVDTIHDSAESLLDIVNDILDYSKIEAGKLSLEVGEFDVVSLVEGSAELVAGRAREKGLSLATFVAPEVPRLLRGDQGRIRQVLVNFLTNSVKFTSNGEVVVRVSLLHSSEDVAQVRFTVTDTGIGIDPDFLPHIFEPFTQADGSVTRKFGGTGLGLSISKRLVDLMDGQIGADSVAGQGSNFWFSLPLEKPARRAQIKPTKPIFQDVALLMVDGPERTSQIIRASAAAWGITCEHAETGEQALQMMRTRAKEGAPFDIAIVDFLLTHSDAMALVQSAKRFRDLAGTKFILISSFDDEKLAQDAIRAGFAAVLPKPIKQSRLYDCLVDLLTQRERIGLQSAVTAPDFVNHATAEPQMHGNNVVLVVEDNPVNQKVVMLQLKELGYPAHAAANGREALDALSRTDYALVLMDCQMPELDGFETTRLIREHETFTGGRHIPIVALTAHAMKEDKMKCISAGMDDYISKPVKPSALREALAKYITAEAPAPGEEFNAAPPGVPGRPGAEGLYPSSPPTNVDESKGRSDF